MSLPPDRIRVLYVDDDPTFLEMATEHLERERDAITCTSVTSASAALDRLAGETTRFDCVVSDLRMPGRDGLDLLRVVREDHSQLPFILHTGSESERNVRDALQAGATDYLQKKSGGTHYALLATRIENAVARYRADRTVARLETLLDRGVETTPGSVVLLDADGQFQYVGPAAGSALGYSRSTLRGEALFEYVHPDDRASATALVSPSVDDRSRHSSVDVRVKQPDGSWHQVTCYGWNDLEEDRLASIELYIQGGDPGGETAGNGAGRE